MCQQMISKAIMFGLYDRYSSLLMEQRLVKNVLFDGDEGSVRFNRYLWQSRQDVVLGISAACMSGWTELFLLPFERVQSVLQVAKYHDKYENTLDCFRRIGRDGRGFREYYRGLSACATRNASGTALFFGCRGHLREHLPDSSHSPVQRVFNDFASGAALGAAISTVTYPLNVIKSNMQATVGGPFHNFISAARHLYKERGNSLGFLYRGVQLNIGRAFLSWGIINATYELLAQKQKRTQ